MFLRKTSRLKDGKVHDYWSVAENARAGKRVVQRQLLYLGEIDEDRQNAWLNAIGEIEDRKETDARDYLIPPPTPDPPRETKIPVRIRLSQTKVENIRERGACWLGLSYGNKSQGPIAKRFSRPPFCRSFASVHRLVHWVVAGSIRLSEASDVSLLFALRSLRRACMI